MILTEEEARKRWCHLRLPQPLRKVANMADVTGCLCDASNCMAWRWTKIYRELHGGTMVKLVPIPEAERTGFCGLAFKE